MTPTTISRIDAKQPAIVEALRKAGCVVQHTHQIGHGCPDIFVSTPSGRTIGMEIKAPGGRLTRDEQEWFARWLGEAYIVYGVEDALRAVGAME